MGECKGEECTGEGAGELSKSKSGVLRTTHAADIRTAAVLCTRRAGGSVSGERETRQGSGLDADKSDRLEGVAETDSSHNIKEAEACGYAGIVDITGHTVVQSK